MRNIYQQIPDMLSAGVPLVLATVTSTRGSTPQKPGSSALFGEHGLISGTVGGGVVEGRVQKLAAEAILSRNSGLFHFNLANDISSTEEAICGGQISVLIDARLDSYISVFEELKQSMSGRIPGVMITMVTVLTGTSINIDRYWISGTFDVAVKNEVAEQLEMAVRKLISDKKPSGFCELKIGIEGEDPSSLFFLQPVFPPEHLVIVGAGHIGRALSHLGSLLNFEVTVVDDRPEFANDGNIPDADHLIVKDIGEAMQGLTKEEDTYVVIVTRGHRDDAAALKPCIGKSLAYTGMIGSKNKIAAMRQNFIENGFATAGQWDQIHAPVGLNIRSQTVEEIAVSIAAELILVRNSKR